MGVCGEDWGFTVHSGRVALVECIEEAYYGCGHFNQLAADVISLQIFVLRSLNYSDCDDEDDDDIGIQWRMM